MTIRRALAVGATATLTAALTSLTVDDVTAKRVLWMVAAAAVAVVGGWLTAWRTTRRPPPDHLAS